MEIVCSLIKKIFIVNTCIVDIEARNEAYADYVHKMAPKSKFWSSLFFAFLIGGLITVLGQSFYILLDEFTTYDREAIGAMVATILIIAAAILTAIGVYDKIGAISGGGSIVPITGFSNAIAATAMEHRKEGLIFGTCSNMFKIAGPVIVVGVALSMLVGLIYWIIGLF